MTGMSRFNISNGCGYGQRETAFLSIEAVTQIYNLSPRYKRAVGD